MKNRPYTWDKSRPSLDMDIDLLNITCISV